MKNLVKKLMVVTMVLLPCFQTDVMAGNGGDPDPEDIPIVLQPNPGSNPTPRNRARARYIEEVPTCTYYEGEVTIEAGSGITLITASVERAEDNATWSDAAMDDTLIMSVSDEPGTYYLTFTLSNGKSYMGKYILY
jgi:hypothetical protein